LSEESVYHRYFSSLKLTQRIAHERLTRICFNDYDREIALVVERKDEKGSNEILGVGRLSKAHDRDDGEFAIIVSDRWQKHGLGKELLKRLVQIARDEKLSRLSAIILAENRSMIHVAQKAGFKIKEEPGARDFIVEYIL
jgi:acetyltransferase